MSKSNWSRHAVALAIASTLVTACSDTSGPNTDSAAGIYDLESLNGLHPPVPLGGFYGYTLEYTSSRLSLAGDKSYHERSIVTERIDGNIVQVDTADTFGLWRQNQSRVVLVDVANSDSLVTTLQNGKLTFDVTVEDSIYHYVYRRQ